MSALRRRPHFTPETAVQTATLLKAQRAPVKPDVLDLELELDGAERPQPRRPTPPHVDGSIKSAIIRWLNEEL